MKYEWVLNILKCFVGLGGRASNRMVYSCLEQRIALEPHHRKPQWGNRRAFENQVRSHLSNLCESGQLRMLHPGLHEITEAGTIRVNSN
jgi:hypothetical protein